MIWKSKLLLVILAGFPSIALSHCDNKEPLGNATGFRFESPPEADFDVSYFNTTVKFLQDDDAYADSRTDCTHLDPNDENSPNPFYNNATFLLANGSSITCAEAIDGKVSHEVYFNGTLNITIPDDTTDCCDSFRFRQNQDLGPYTLGLDEDVSVVVTLNVQDAFGSEAVAKVFTELCEELFICSQYISFDNLEKCQATGSSRCPKYTQRSLCFEDFYEPGNEEEKDKRLEFILQNCWGVSSNPDFGALLLDEGTVHIPGDSNNHEWVNPNSTLVLENLKSNVESLCSSATERSNENLFETTGNCTVLLECYKSKLPADIDPQAKDAIDDSAYHICGDLDEIELERAGQECADTSSKATRAEYNFTAICPDYLQPSFTSFPPDYPNDNNDDSVYKSNILDRVNADFNSRTDASELGGFKILKVALAGVNIIAEGLRDALPEDYLWTWKNFFWAGSSVGLEVVDSIIDKYDFHDGNVDGAEIEAVYENTRQLLDGEAAVYDAVRCRKSLVEGSDDLPAKWGQGCDSIDNDCDRFVDECDEDRILPVIDTSLSFAQCSNQWFDSITGAQDCINLTLSAKDDCDRNVAVATSWAGSCENTVFNVTASTSRCKQFSETLFTTKVDTVVPKLSCTVDGETDIILEATGANVLQNIVLAYDNIALNDCSNDLHFTVKVFANEIEDFHSQEMAVFYKHDSSAKQNIYVAKGLCETPANGQCIKDPNLSYARLYTVNTTAIDAAGNSDWCKNRILILPKKLINDGFTDFNNVTGSTQRFLLAKYSHVINP